MEVENMLGENIKILRQQKGLSQETLAQQINVVRQTVSKWEKGLSVPDAEMLNTLSELFEVPVSTLLGNTIEQEEKTTDSSMEEVAKQLAILNEQLALNASRRREKQKKLLIGILITFVLSIAIWFACYQIFRVQSRRNAVMTTTSIVYTLDGKEYEYSVTYDQNFQIYEAGGDAFIANHILVEQYDDANVLLAQIEDYFKDRGGTFKIVDEE